MIKGVFVFDRLSEEKLAMILRLGANAVFTGHENLRVESVKKFKDKKIKVYAEVGLFCGQDLLKKYPDARAISREGKLKKKVDWYMGTCPNHPRIRREKLEVIKRIVDKFPVDGVWLDFIRYPSHWETVKPELTEYCFCQTCLKKFKKEVGVDHEGQEWIRWKSEQITRFVAQSRAVIKARRKQVKLGLFAVPWQSQEFAGAIMRVIGQDFKLLSQYIDMFSPMTYQAMCGRSTDWIAKTVAYFNQITNKPVLPLVQTENKPRIIASEEFENSIKAALRPPSAGVIIFYLEDLLKNEERTKAVEKFFKIG